MNISVVILYWRHKEYITESLQQSGTNHHNWIFFSRWASDRRCEYLIVEKFYTCE